MIETELMAQIYLFNLRIKDLFIGMLGLVWRLYFHDLYYKVDISGLNYLPRTLKSIHKDLKVIIPVRDEKLGCLV